MSAPPVPSRRAPCGPALLLLIAATGLGACTSAPATTATVPGSGVTGLVMTVDHVVDGDTIDVSGNGATERVRLLGIDTPETVKPNTPVQCFGPEASARTKALLPPGTQVVLQRDEEARDRYGRLLAYAWRKQDGLFVNRSLVAGGYARTLSISPNTAHATELAQARGEAQAEGAGLWGTCGGGR